MRIFFYLVIFFSIFSSSFSQKLNEPMTFVYTNVIIAKGEITRDTPELFKAFLKANKKLGQQWDVTIRLTSSGGHLLSGLEIGRLIRSHQMSVTVVDYCASACVFTMIGGVNRSLEDEAKIGVHQFYIPSAIKDPTKPQFTGEDLIAQQKLNGRLQDYAAEMGVESGIVALASQIEPSKIFILTSTQITSLNLLHEKPIQKELTKLNLIEEIIICNKRPHPSNEIERLQSLGIIKNKRFQVIDSVSYFEVIKPLDFFGIKVLAISGFDQNYNKSKNFSRGPGTSPGYQIGVVLNISEAETTHKLKELGVIKTLIGNFTKPSIGEINTYVSYFPKNIKSNFLTEVSCNLDAHFTRG